MRFICVLDNLEFLSFEDLELHERSGHSLKPEGTQSVANPSLNNPKEFEKTLEMIQAEEKKKASQVPRQTNTESLNPNADKQNPIPLELKYTWTGTDDKGHNVKTLAIDTEAGFYVVAFCLSCDKEIKSVKVAKLQTFNKPKEILQPIGKTKLQKALRQTNI